jgi:hypothetical protein
LGPHVTVGVGVGVGDGDGDGVGVGDGVTLAPQAETLLVSSVTAPVSAKTLPATLAPKFKVSLMLETMFPTN